MKRKKGNQMSILQMIIFLTYLWFEMIITAPGTLVDITNCTFNTFILPLLKGDTLWYWTAIYRSTSNNKHEKNAISFNVFLSYYQARYSFSYLCLATPVTCLYCNSRFIVYFISCCYYQAGYLCLPNIRRC